MGASKRFDWERVIRTLDLHPPTLKLVALMLATYADGATGSNAHPGEDRLASECGLTTRQIRTHLATLRDLGLIVRTFDGSKSGRKRLADEYELAVPADILSRVEEWNRERADDLRKRRDHRKLASGAVAPEKTQLGRKPAAVRPEADCRPPEASFRLGRKLASGHHAEIKDGEQTEPSANPVPAQVQTARARDSAKDGSSNGQVQQTGRAAFAAAREAARKARRA